MVGCKTLKSHNRRLHLDHTTTLVWQLHISLYDKGIDTTRHHTLYELVTIVILAIYSRKDHILSSHNATRIGSDIPNPEILATQLTAYDMRNIRQ
jgi:hypothetical protein